MVKKPYRRIFFIFFERYCNTNVSQFFSVWETANATHQQNCSTLEHFFRHSALTELRLLFALSLLLSVHSDLPPREEQGGLPRLVCLRVTMSPLSLLALWKEGMIQVNRERMRLSRSGGVISSTEEDGYDVEDGCDCWQSEMEYYNLLDDAISHFRYPQAM